MEPACSVCGKLDACTCTPADIAYPRTSTRALEPSPIESAVASLITMECGARCPIHPLVDGAVCKEVGEHGMHVFVACGCSMPPNHAYMARTTTSDRLAHAAQLTAKVAIEGRDEAEARLKVAQKLIAKLQDEAAELRGDVAALWYSLGTVLPLFGAKEARTYADQKLITDAANLHAAWKPE